MRNLERRLLALAGCCFALHLASRIGFEVGPGCILMAQAQQATSSLLVLNQGNATSSVLLYDGSTGAFTGTFITLPNSIAGSSGSYSRMIVGPGSDLYLRWTGPRDSRILLYEGTTGKSLGTFATCTQAQCGGNFSGGMTFGPDGNFYASVGDFSGFTGRIVRFNGSTGALLDVFVPPGRGGLGAIDDFAFGADGKLYVYSRSLTGPSVLRFDGNTGAFVDAFITGMTDLPTTPGVTMVFGPNGPIYIGGQARLTHYDQVTGLPLGVVVESGGSFMGFGPDGNIYFLSGGVDKYDGKTGASLGTLVPRGSGGLNSPVWMAFSSRSITIPTNTIFYPQLAVGGGYEVVLILNNTTETAWSGVAKPLPNAGLDYLNTVIALRPGETKKYVLTGGTETVSTGLQIIGDQGSTASALAASYFFNFLDSGKLLDSTGVPKGVPARKFTFPVERSGVIDTGFAIRRLPDQPDSPITLTLFDATGSQVGETSTASDFAKFITQFFTQLPAEFLGSVVAQSDDDFYLVVIRLEQTADGFQLTSVPAEPN